MASEEPTNKSNESPASLPSNSGGGGVIVPGGSGGADNVSLLPDQNGNNEKHLIDDPNNGAQSPPGLTQDNKSKSKNEDENSSGETPPSNNTAATRPPHQKAKASPSICKMQNCTNPIARVIGDCRWCTEKFCLKHRLPEAHSCQNISGCRAEASNGLAKRLLREKCISNKV